MKEREGGNEKKEERKGEGEEMRGEEERRGELARKKSDFA